MTYRRLLPLALALALPAPATAHADPPWSPPSTVSRASAAVPTVAFTPRGGAVLWRSQRLFAAPFGQPPRTVAGVPGLVAAGDRLVYAGVRYGRGGAPARLYSATAADPGAKLKLRRIGGSVKGTILTAVAANGPHAAIAYGTLPRGRLGRGVVRLAARGTLRTLSGHGRIHGVAVAVDPRGDVLTAWERSGRIEARLLRASGRLGPVRRLGRAVIARQLTAALASRRRGVVAWVDQAVSEGEAGSAARIRGATLAGGRARTLERYPDDGEIVGGRGVLAAAAGARLVVTWTGRHGIRATFARGPGFAEPQQLGPLGDRTYDRNGGLAGLATAPSGAALVAWVAPEGTDFGPGRVMAAPLGAAAATFGTAETVSGVEPLISAASPAFDPRDGTAYVAWGTQDAVRVSSRPAP
jgi:hypothetical protein